MKIFPDTKIYVACPGNVATGGPESLHQLCSVMIQYGLNAQMFYTSGNRDNPVAEVNYKYHVPYVWEVEDNPHNVLVLYEIIGEIYYKYQHVQKILWWLSVNNYINDTAKILLEHNDKVLSEPLPKFFYFQDTEKNTEHWVNSDYARLFLMINGVKEKDIRYVESYVSQAFLSSASTVDLSQKEDAILFNPSKGWNVTQRLIQLSSDLQWFPIQGMTPEEVQFVLSKAKVYVDFGNHPGRERIPREAAISGCVIITGKRGSAGNDFDINIPKEFKFEETDEELQKAVEKIRYVFENFETEYDKQKAYREKILNQKKIFEMEVAEACNLNPTEKINSVALWQGYSMKSYHILCRLSEMNSDLIPKFIVDDDLGSGQNIQLDFLTNKNNRNYFNINNVNKNAEEGIPFISTDDAKFLYSEGRIKKFVLLMPDESEINYLMETIHPAAKDILVMDVN
ncbi:MAG: hypothetical protein IKZ58_01400 [Selenomonadaceae bacterium]|nr:hypothetical protein [Selenomonadaceae bacterium]